MVAVSFAFVAGVVVLQQLASLPGLVWLFPIFIVCGFSIKITKLRLIAWFLVGFAWAFLFSWNLMNDRLDGSLEGQNVIVEGRVSGLPNYFDRGVRFGFEIDNIAGISPNRVAKTVRISWYSGSAKVAVGDRWRLEIRLKRPHGNFNVAGFDYQTWLFTNGYRATGYVRESQHNELLGQNAWWYQSGIWRERAAERLGKAVTGADMRGLIKALVIGAKDEISNQQWNILRKTGTAHLMAISGLHIGFVAGFGFFVIKWIWGRFGSLRIAPPVAGAVASIAIAIFYAALAGFSLPTQRALIMLLVVMGGVLLQRNLVPTRGISVALFLTVLLNPLAVLSAGLWLSFTAVAAIVYVVVGRVAVPRKSVWSYQIPVATAVGLVPLLSLYFQQFSLIAPIANMLVVPVIGLVVVPNCLIGAILTFCLPDLAHLLLGLAELVLRMAWIVLDVLSQIPFADWSLPQPPLWVIGIAFLSIAVLFMPKGLPGRWLGLIGLLPLCFPILRPPEFGIAKVSMLDVGQGLSTVVQTQRHCLVFDTGARFSETFNMGSAVVIPFLRKHSLKKVDVLVISHGDNDHIGGASALAKEIDITQVYTSVPEQVTWASARLCHAGQNWRWDGVEFRILSPIQFLSGEGNENSCVLQILAANGDSLLITGDIEAKAETMLTNEYGNKLHSKYLVVPHHGSNTSSTAAFLAVVDPDFGLVSAGYKNRYGFPSPAVLHRLDRSGVSVLITAESGAIQIMLGESSGASLPVLSRQAHGKYYHFTGG